MAYVYKITFEEVPHFYIGVRSKDPEGDGYLGSPVTHRCYWEIYTPKKQILWVFDSWEKACEVEIALIKQNWTNKYCLNENIKGAISLGACSKGGRVLTDKRKNDPEFDLRFRNNARIGGMRSVRVREERRSNDPEFDAKLRRASVERGKATQERRRGDPEFDARYRESSSKGGLKAARRLNSELWQCTVTGYITTAGALTNYQNKRGVGRNNRVKISQKDLPSS